jgi:hypothetical protein
MKITKFLKKYFTNKYQGVYRHAKKLFVFDIILLILAVFLFSSAIFWFFWQPSIASKVEINFAYSSEKIVSGEDLDIFITYQNNSKLNLEEAVLSLHLPTGFVLNKAKNDQISESNSIDLGLISPGGNGKITICGQLIGDTTKTDKILAILSYKIGKTNKIDQKKELGLINYDESEIKSEISFEKTTFPDKEVPFTIKLSNISQKTIEGIGLELPSFLNLEQSAPDVLSPKQELILQGVAKIPKSLGQLPFSYSLVRKFNNHNFIQQKENLFFDVLSPDIGLNLEPQTIYSYLNSDDTLKVNVEFDNLSGNLLQDQKLILFDKNSVLDLENTARINNLKTDGQNLIIDRFARNIFQNGAMIKSDEFILYLKIKNTAGAFASSLFLEPTFSANLFGSDVGFITKGKVLEIPLTSLLQTKIQARYYTPSQDQIGRGPLPPQIGQPTKYWVYLDIQNGANELKNFRFIANLGKNTTFTGKQSVNYGYEMNFDEKTATWEKVAISASTSFNLYFEVVVTPDQNDLGDNLQLLKNAKIIAVDAMTGKNYEINLGEVNNKLQENDEGSKFGSEVIK